MTKWWEKALRICASAILTTSMIPVQALAEVANELDSSNNELSIILPADDDKLAAALNASIQGDYELKLEFNDTTESSSDYTSEQQYVAPETPDQRNADTTLSVSSQELATYSFSSANNVSRGVGDTNTQNETYIAEGTCGTCTWTIDNNGGLRIFPTDGEAGQLAHNYEIAYFGEAFDWYLYRDVITSVVVEEGVSATSLRCMFFDCANLESVDLSGLDTTQLESTSYMFSGCTSLTSLDLSGFNVSNVTNMSAMFNLCTALEDLNLSSWDTSSVIYMNYLFNGCPALTALDLSSFDTSAVVEARYMFSGTAALETLVLGDAFILPTEDDKWSAPDGLWKAVSNSLNYSGYELVHRGAGDTYTLITPSEGWTQTGTCEYQIDGDTLTYRPLGNEESGTLPDTNYEPLLGVNENSVKHVVFEQGVKAGSSLAAAFSGCSNLESIDFGDLDTSAVTDMSHMFFGCSSLTILNLSGFNTSSVTSMYAMFSDCSSLTDLDLSSFKTSLVTSMDVMFFGCSSLVSLVLSSFNTSSVTGMSDMFSGCSSLTELDLSSFNTSSVTNMSSMFYYCSSLSSLDLSSFDTSSVTNMGSMFSGCASLENFTVGAAFVEPTEDGYWSIPEGAWIAGSNGHNYSGYALAHRGVADTYIRNETLIAAGNCGTCTWNIDTYGELRIFPTDGESGVLEHNYDIAYFGEAFDWYLYRDAITSVVIEVGVSATSLRCMFFDCYNLESVDLSGLDTAQLQSTSYMFSGCASLTSLNLSSFDVSHVTNMSAMFNLCTALEDLNLSDWDTSSVIYMNYLFNGCPALASLDLSSFDTSSVVEARYMFSGTAALETLVLGEGFVLPTDDSMWSAPTGVWKASSDSSNYAEYELVHRGIADTYRAITVSEGWTQAGTCEYQIDDDTLTYRPLGDEDSSLLGILPDTSYQVIFGGNTLPGVNDSSVKHVVFEPGVKAGTSLSGAFSGCSNLKSIDFGSMDTSSVTSMSYMFYDCSSLTSLDLSGLATSSVTSMDSMFRNCSSLSSLNLEGLDTLNVTSMPNLFYNCSSLRSLDLSSFDTSSVNNMEGMFAWCSSLTQIDLSNFSTSSVGKGSLIAGSMDEMFEHCSGLTSLNLSSFDTSSVKSMKDMFSGCSRLTSLILSSFDTSSVGNMSGMFENCYSFTSLDLSTFVTSAVVNMRSMFSDCSSLTSLDLSSFNTTAVTNMKDMFLNCDSLESLTVGEGFVEPTTDGYWSAPDGVWRSASSDLTYSGYELAHKGVADTYIRDEALAYTGTCGSCTWTIGTNGELRIFPTDGESGQLIHNYDGGYLELFNWYPYHDVITRVVFEDGVSATDLSLLFCDLNNLKSVDFSGLDTSSVTNMSFMFYNCPSLWTLDVSSFDTSSVTNMNGMFATCSSLISLDLSSFDTSSVTDMSNMFYGCSSLVSLDLSNFEISSVQEMLYAFDECTSLARLTLGEGFVEPTEDGCWSVPDGEWRAASDDQLYSGYELAHRGIADTYTTDDKDFASGTCGDCTWIINTNGILQIKPADGESGQLVHNYEIYDDVYGFEWYQYCDVITRVVIADGVSATDLSYMFYDCNNLKSVDLSGLDTSSATNMNAMFDGCQCLTSVDLSHFVTSSVTDMSNMFAGCSELVSLNLSSFETTAVTDTSRMFMGCSSLVSLELSTFDTSSVTDMSYMFCGCSSITSFNLSSLDTSLVTNMSGMFSGCSALTELDLSAIDTSLVTNMSGMFSGCSALTELDLSAIDTSLVTNMSYIISGCSALETLILSGFDTSSASDLSFMFYNCSSLTSLDLSSFDTTSATDMRGMFSGCVALESLTVGASFIEPVEDGFWSVPNGEWAADSNGHVYSGYALAHREVADTYTRDETNISAGTCGTCAWTLDKAGVLRIFPIDGVSGQLVHNYKINYFGDSFDWYQYHDDIASVVIEDGVSGIDLSYLFYACSNLKSVDLSGLDTSSVTDMSGMFTGCSSLESLDLSGLDTSSVTDMSGMLSGCSSLTEINLSGLDTSSVTNMSAMFSSCSSLTSLEVSDFLTSSVTDMSAMFIGCSSLGVLNLSSFDTSSVTDMRDMFWGCSSLSSLDLSGFNTTSVTKMREMFYNCSSLSSLNLSGFDTSSVSDMVSMVSGCSSLTTLDLSSFDTSSVTNMSYMFSGCTSLESFTVSESFIEPTDLGYWSAPNGDWRSASDSSISSGYELAHRGVADTYTRVFNLSGATVTVSKQTYTGSELTPEVTVKLNDRVLVEGTDYAVSYSNNIEVGTASVTVTGIGSCYGTVDTSFEIVEPVELVATVTTTPVEIGDIATFICTVSGVSLGLFGETLTYQWQYSTDGGQTWKNLGWTGAKTSKLSAEATAYRVKTQQYRCLVNASGGRSAVSEPVTFDITPKTVVLVATAAITPVTLGETATFTCRVTGVDGSRLSYQWQYSTDDGVTWKNLGWAGAKTATLSETATAYRAETQQYRCVVEASDGRSAITDVVSFDVVSKTTELMATAATTPVALGEVSAFTCSVEGVDGARLSYQWQYTTDGGTSWKNLNWAGAKTASLSAEATAYRARTQQYRCVVDASDGRSVITNAIGLEIVSAINATASTTPVAMGEQGTFTCMVEGADGADLTYQWQYSTNGQTWKNLGWEGSRTNAVTAEATDYRASTQQYRCVVTSSNGGFAITNSVAFDILSAD